MDVMDAMERVCGHIEGVLSEVKVKHFLAPGSRNNLYCWPSFFAAKAGKGNCIGTAR